MLSSSIWNHLLLVNDRQYVQTVTDDVKRYNKCRGNETRWIEVSSAVSHAKVNHVNVKQAEMPPTSIFKWLRLSNL